MDNCMKSKVILSSLNVKKIMELRSCNKLKSPKVHNI